jgi:hypothetical protein
MVCDGLLSVRNDLGKHAKSVGLNDISLFWLMFAMARIPGRMVTAPQMIAHPMCPCFD